MTASGLGKILLVLAAVLGVTGALLLLVGSSKVPFGRLPGDVAVRKGNFRLYVPIATSLLLSVVLTVVLNLILRRR